MALLFVMKLHISIHHDIVSAISMSFAGQGLSLTYLTRFVEHCQIYVNSLCFATFLKRLNNFLFCPRNDSQGPFSFAPVCLSVHGALKRFV